MATANRARGATFAEYVKLKEKHEQNIKKIMSAFRGDRIERSLTRPGIAPARRLRQFSGRTLPCVLGGCQNRSRIGTIFRETAEAYVAMCGHPTNPCAKRVEVKKRRVQPLTDVLSELESQIRDANAAISRAHLDYAYGDGGEGSIAAFEEAFSALRDGRKRYDVVVPMYAGYYQYRNFDEEISSLVSEIEDAVQEVRRLLAADRPTDADVREAVALHVGTLIPKTKRLRDIYAPIRHVDVKYDSKKNIELVECVSRYVRAEDLEVKAP